MTSQHQVGRALAYAFLAAPTWRQAALEQEGRRTLGRWFSWLRPLVGSVLDHYPTPPADRPRQLARFLATHPIFTQAWDDARAAGVSIPVRTVRPVPAAMAPARWPVPPCSDLADLARLLQVQPEHLDWLADTRGMQRRTRVSWFHTYRYDWLSRPGATPRLLEAPTPLLRETLRRLLSRVLAAVPVHPAAHGFVAGRSALTHARRHVGHDVVVTLDLRHFFAGITAARIYGVFRQLGYPEPVAYAAAALVTNRVPTAVLAQIPPGGDASDRHLLRARLRTPHLPQGAPTSPALANLVCYGLDARLSGYAAASGIRYTRYADDLTFSGPDTLRRGAPRLVAAVGRVVVDEGFVLHRTKTRVQPRGDRQLVTGLVVNDQLGVPRAAYERLRATLHEATTRGVEVANRSGHPNFRDHLGGRISWVESANPARGERLRQQFEAIVWPDREP